MYIRDTDLFVFLSFCIFVIPSVSLSVSPSFCPSGILSFCLLSCFSISDSDVLDISLELADVLDISLELAPYHIAGSYWLREVLFSQSVIDGQWRALEVIEGH